MSQQVQQGAEKPPRRRKKSLRRVGATQKVHACRALQGSLVSILLLAVQYLVFLIVLVN
jgi:hypothetical protein